MSHKMENNKLEKHFWIWPIAWYLFLGGLGGGTLFVCCLLDFLYGIPYLLAPAALLAVGCLGIGSVLLVFELGQPPVFLRVFLSATAIIKWGACLLILAMGFGFVYFCFYLPPGWNLPWYSWTWLRDVCAWGMGLAGLCVVVYTGVLLCTMKSKPFWNTPALPVLFTASALSTATALVALCSVLWTIPLVTEFWFDGHAPTTIHLIIGTASIELLHANELITETVHLADTILIVAEIVVLVLFVLLHRASGNTTAKAVALEWISGSKALLFWVGMIACGLIIPFALYGLGGVGATFVAPVLVLAAGLLLRFLIIYSDKRRAMPGEEKYYARLPKGNERFLQGWKAPY